MNDNIFKTIPFEPSVENIPGANASAIFLPRPLDIFREESEGTPSLPLADGTEIVAWGADNQMPYKILDAVEQDETMSTCMMFNAEALYGAGLHYNTDHAAPHVLPEVEDFLCSNNLATYWLGAAQDFKHFGFAISVIILSRDGKRILSLHRKEACYCRFVKAGDDGKIPAVVFGNFRRGASYNPETFEKIPLLDPNDPLCDLRRRVAKGRGRKFAVVSRIPTVDSCYYPIPYYGSLFRSKWYDIKRLIGAAKEAKLRNSAPIKYQIEISDRYWEKKFIDMGITDPEKQREAMLEEKNKMIDFLTGAENSGKVIFSEYHTTPDGRTINDVVIKKIDVGTQGGDWATDIQEAVNMICFTLRVHSNLVGSVPGKSQSNNSGSDKRELYTITQALQQPYRDLLFAPHRLIIAFNGWRGVKPECPFVQLTTLDEHKDSKKVEINPEEEL